MLNRTLGFFISLSFCVLMVLLGMAQQKSLCIKSKVVEKIDILENQRHSEILSCYLRQESDVNADTLFYHGHLNERIKQIESEIGPEHIRLVILKDRKDYFTQVKQIIFISEDLIQVQGLLEKLMISLKYSSISDSLSRDMIVDLIVFAKTGYRSQLIYSIWPQKSDQFIKYYQNLDSKQKQNILSHPYQYLNQFMNQSSFQYQIHSDEIVYLPRDQRLKSERLKSIFKATEMNLSTQVIAVDDQRLWIMPTKTDIDQRLFHKISGKKLIMEMCGVLPAKYLIPFHKIVEKILIIQNCQNTHIRYTEYFKNGVPGFAHENPQLSFVSIHLPSLFMKTDQVKKIGDVFAELGKKQNEFSVIYQWANTKIEDNGYIVPQAVISGIDSFRL